MGADVPFHTFKQMGLLREKVGRRGPLSKTDNDLILAALSARCLAEGETIQVKRSVYASDGARARSRIARWACLTRVPCKPRPPTPAPASNLQAHCVLFFTAEDKPTGAGPNCPRRLISELTAWPSTVQETRQAVAMATGIAAAAAVQKERKRADNASVAEHEVPDHGGEAQEQPELDEQGAKASSCAPRPLVEGVKEGAQGVDQEF